LLEPAIIDLGVEQDLTDLDFSVADLVLQQMDGPGATALNLRRMR